LTSRRGHFVDKVLPNSKAEEAGLKHGDLLVEVNGVMVRDFSHSDLVKYDYTVYLGFGKSSNQLRKGVKIYSGGANIT